jgi:hypothetical protein
MALNQLLDGRPLAPETTRSFLLLFRRDFIVCLSLEERSKSVHGRVWDGLDALRGLPLDMILHIGYIYLHTPLPPFMRDLDGEDCL